MIFLFEFKMSGKAAETTCNISAHRYFRKQQPLRGEATWLTALLGMWLETYSWKEAPCARAGAPLKGAVGHGQPTPALGHHGGTVCHCKSMLEWRETS